MKVLTADTGKCKLEKACEAACAKAVNKKEGAQYSAIQVAVKNGGPSFSFCDQCGECIDVCPTIALVRDKQGIVRIKNPLCVGCLSCVGFCPTEAMFMHADDIVPFNCINCGKCIQVCAIGALALEELPDAELTETEKRLAAQAKAVA